MDRSGILVGSLMLALALAAEAGEIYKWTDDEGRIHYGDTPAPGAETVGESGGFSVLKSIDQASGATEPSSHSPGRPRASRSYGWLEGASGYESALRTHRKTDAPLLVYFRTDWCPHCRRFDATILEPEVERYFGSFVKVRINPEAGDAERAIFKHYQGTGFPSLYLHTSPSTPARKMSSSGGGAELVARFRQAVGG